MVNKNSKWVVGATAWLVPSSARAVPREVTIYKVGTKWVLASTTDLYGYEYSVETGVAKGSIGAPDKLYAAKAEWEAEVARIAAWKALRFVIENQYNVPAGLSAEAILEATKLLTAK